MSTKYNLQKALAATANKLTDVAKSVPQSITTHNASQEAHEDIREEIETLSERIDTVQSGGLTWLTD